jgi:hypothetical protein
LGDCVGRFDAKDDLLLIVCGYLAKLLVDLRIGGHGEIDVPQDKYSG